MIDRNSLNNVIEAYLITLDKAVKITEPPKKFSNEIKEFKKLFSAGNYQLSTVKEFVDSCENYMKKLKKHDLREIQNVKARYKLLADEFKGDYRFKSSAKSSMNNLSAG